METLHIVFLVCVRSVNHVSQVAHVVAVWVRMDHLALNLLRRVIGSHSVLVRRKDIGECVSHLDFAIECPAKECLVRVEGAVTHCMSGCRR